MKVLEYRGVTFQLSNKVSDPSFFVLGVRKSGSSILNSMVTALANRQGLPFIDIAGLLFKKGVKTSEWQMDSGLEDVLGGGNVYGGFRNFPISLAQSQKFESCKKILLVRDPRDALVSEYFSNAYSHSVPQSGGARQQILDLREQALAVQIDSYVIDRSNAMLTTLSEYLPLTKDPLTQIFRYEDVITQKEKLLRDISAHFGWSVDDRHLGHILSWADVLPNEERPTEFVRKVLPGDHKNKLSVATIERLNSIFGSAMAGFGYHP